MPAIAITSPMMAGQPYGPPQNLHQEPRVLSTSGSLEGPLLLQDGSQREGASAEEREKSGHLTQLLRPWPRRTKP
jgi:hypothetical protein